MNKSTVKKILSLILSVVMLLSLMPLSPRAAADETSALPSDPVETPEPLLDEKEIWFLNYVPGEESAFRKWYILQHWDSLEADVQPKPFVTVIEFTVSFSGTLG